MLKNKDLFIFLLTHLIVWTVIPSVTNHNLPLDTIEHIAWGSNLDWGFNKHPPFVGVPLKVFFELFGNQDWVFYLLSQIFVISAFYFIYLFSKDLLNNEQNALCSVLMLESIFFFNFTTPEFNVNIAQLPFWALIIFLSYRYFQNEKDIKYLAAIGVCAAIGMLTKYLFVFLLIGLAIYFLIKIKQSGFKIKYFFPIFIFIILITPHFLWLIENSFATFTYALKRAGQDKSLLDHLINPLVFLFKQIGILSLFIILSFYLFKKINFKFSFKDKNFVFLFCLIIVPIIFLFLTSLLLGSKIRTMWMTPFYLGLGTFLIYTVKNKIVFSHTYKISFILIFFSSMTYGAVSIINEQKRTDYKGKEVAKNIQGRWDNWVLDNQLSKNKIISIHGDEWFAGNLIYNLKDKPKWFDERHDKFGKNKKYIRICNDESKCLKIDYKNLQ